MKTLMNKTRGGLVLLAISSVLIFSGCSGQTANSLATSTSTNASSSPENSPSNADGSAQEQKNPYAVAGIEDPEKFNEFFRTVQELVAKDDKEKLADYVLYPMNVFTPDKKEQIKDRKAFIANYDRIFTKSIKENLQNQKIEDLFANWQGVSTEGGLLWFGVREGGLVGIMTVNQPA
jgi:hypothetical protein